VAFAHSGGHGAKIEGIGPGGGRLAPVILAADAEKGAAAETQAVVEWFLEGEKLRIVFWDKERKQALPVKAVKNKWILLGGALAKPEVMAAGLELESASLKKADSVEVIVPALGPKGQKQVALIELGPRAAKTNCVLVRCQGKECGCDLLKAGWKELARCPGHSWAYVIEKDGRRKICKGINARSGPTETSCEDFTGELKEFRACK
jgi:hypothetical protein